MRRREIFRHLRDGAAKIIEKRKTFEKMKTPEKIVTRDTIEDQMRALKFRLSALKNLQTKRDQLTSEEAKWTHTVDAYLRDVKSHAASKQGDSDMESTNIPLCLEKLFEDVTEIIQRRNAFEAEKTEKSVTCETISDQIRSDCGPRPNEAMRKHAAYYGKSMDELMSSRKAVLEELQRKEDGLGIEEARWEATMDAYERIDGLASRSVPIVGRLRKRRRVCYRDVDARESIQYKVDQVVEIQNGPDDVRATIVRVTGDSVTVRYHSDNFEETIIGEDRQDRILRIVDDDDASDGEPSKSSATTVTANRLDDETIVYEEGQVVKVKYGDNPLRATIVRVEGDSVTVRCRVDNSEETIVGEDRRHRILRIPGTNDACDKEPSKSSAAPVTPNARMSVPAPMPASVARASRRTSKYKGVNFHSFRKDGGEKWHARLNATKFSKMFSSEEEAAKAYDAEARKKFGDSAVTNFSLTGDFNPNAKRTTQRTASAVGEHGPNRSIGILEEEEPSKSSPSTVIPNARMSVPAQIPAPAARTSSESSTYKGVSLHSTSKETPWLAQLAVAKFAKTYKNEEEAAKAYDEAARKHFGDSAVTNFFPNGERNPNAKRTRQGTAVAVGAMSSPTASPVSARTSALRVSPQSQKTARKKEFTERLDYLRRRGWKIIPRSGNHYTYEAPNGGKTFSRLDEAETHHKKHKQRSRKRA